MDFREYRKSAVRHYLTCEYLLSGLKSQKLDYQKNILINIYYLSGYIVETSLSYAYFSHVKFKGDVEESLEYQNGFKTHRFDIKIRFLKEKNGDLNSVPFISKKVGDERLNLLFNNWSTDFRYCTNHRVKEKDLSEDIIHKYLHQVHELLEILLKRF